MQNIFRSGILLTASIISVTAGLQIFSSAKADTIETVTVTASKFGATDLEKTPITISQVSGDTLVERDVRDITQLASQVPGLLVDPGSSSPRIALRGISQDQFGLEAENP